MIGMQRAVPCPHNVTNNLGWDSVWTLREDLGCTTELTIDWSWWAWAALMMRVRRVLVG